MGAGGGGVLILLGGNTISDSVRLKLNAAWKEGVGGGRGGGGGGGAGVLILLGGNTISDSVRLKLNAVN